MNNITELEILNMINDTSNIVKKEKIRMFTSLTQACNQTNKLTSDVEFWKWMGANYKNNFGTINSIKQTAELIPKWTNIQLQGKGYEWDFLMKK